MSINPAQFVVVHRHPTSSFNLYVFEVTFFSSVSLSCERRFRMVSLILFFLQKQPTETEKLDENIRMWSYGKETDIRLLLSTLHHVRFSLFLNS